MSTRHTWYTYSLCAFNCLSNCSALIPFYCKCQNMCSDLFFFPFFLPPSWKLPEKQGQQPWETWPSEYLKSITLGLRKSGRSRRTVNTHSRFWASSLSVGGVRCETSSGHVTWQDLGRAGCPCSDQPLPLLSWAPRHCPPAVPSLLPTARQSTAAGRLCHPA